MTGRDLDVLLSLFDRQVLDAEDAPIGKVDDVELGHRADGRLMLEALLLGPDALTLRFGEPSARWSHAIWARLRTPNTPAPARIALGALTRLDGAVHVAVRAEQVGNDGLERWVRRHLIGKLPGSGVDEPAVPDRAPSGAPDDAASGAGERAHRVGDLLGMNVLGAAGHSLGVINDLRVSWRKDAHARNEFVVAALIVGPGRAGGLLGYDRRQEQGPALVRAIVRRLHRGSLLVPWHDVATVDWTARTVRLRVEEGRRLESDLTG